MRSRLCVQLRLLFSVFAKLYIPTFAILMIFALASTQTGIPMSTFTRDPAAIMNVDPFFGALSKMGILFWCASAAICLFGVALLRSKAIAGELPAFFLVSGLITSALLLDDLFLLHEEVFPKYFHIPQKAIYSGYITTAVLYLARFRRTILETEFTLLLFALGFLGLSMAIDSLPRSLLPWHYLFEDGSKLFGIVSWLGYSVRACLQAIEWILPQQTQP